MRSKSAQQEIIWKKLDQVIDIDEEETYQNNQYDNDSLTLEQERQNFQALLTRINPLIRIDHLEKERSSPHRDLFILSIESVKFVDQIQALLKEKTIQYEVAVDLYRVPPQGFGSAGDKKPLQYTVAIARLPLKRVNRLALLANFLFALFYLGLFVFLLISFYRIIV